MRDWVEGITVVLDTHRELALWRRGDSVEDYVDKAGGYTVSADDDVVVGRLEAPLTGVARLDLLALDQQGEVYARLEDIPFNAGTGEVLFCPSVARLKQLPAHTDRVHLVAKDGKGERLIGDYTFIHTPPAIRSRQGEK